MTASLKTDGTTEKCSCFYEERVTGKQRAALTIKVELFIAKHPRNQESSVQHNHTSCQKFEQPHNRLSKYPQNVRLQTQISIVFAFSK